MNKNFHRVIWSAARGMRVVVHEAAVSAGKGASQGSEAGAPTHILKGSAAFAMTLMGAALAALLAAPDAHAQIVANPFVPGAQRPTVLVAPNGVPYVNITTPSAAGVSRNQYIQFDVNARGVIVNNSRTTVQSQLGGFIQSNPYLATGPARIIVNEVSSSNPSYINGPVEIAGQRAEFILANPSGISVNGGTFLNAAGVTLTTGTPQYNAFGGLDSYVVRGGTVTVGGTGLDVSKSDYAAILARAVQVNAAINATDLKVVTGANTVSVGRTQITPTTGTGAAPTFALDVDALGGMFANKITMIGTEAGLGVRNAGSIGASAGSLVVTAAGRLENSGTLEGQSVQLASTGSDIVNQGTIRQTSMAQLSLSAPTISNANGGWIGSEPVSASNTGNVGAGTSAGTSGASGTTGSTGTTTSTGGTTTGGTSTATVAATDPGSITAAGAIRNDGGKVYAGGPITLQTANLLNDGGTLSVASMSLNQPGFSNQGGTIHVSGAFTANLGTFSNNAGTLHAGSLDITTTGDLNNQDGVLTSDSDANLTLGGGLNNTRGTLSATGALTANVAGALQNTAGKLASNQNLHVTSQSLDNSQGHVSSAGGNVQLTVAQQLLNTGGHIASGGSLAIQTGSLDGSGGNLQSTGDMNVTATQALTSTGTNVAGGNATFKGASVDLSGSQTGAANIAITATEGNVTTSGATVATSGPSGTLAIIANAQPGQTLVNSAGQLNAAQLQIDASNIANTHGGEIVQTGTGATVLAVSGSIDNSNSHIATNGQDLTLQAVSITNTSGKIDHAGTGTLTIAGGSFNGANGKITGNGALAVNLTGAFNQDGGTTYAQQIGITAGSLSNQNGGSIVQSGAATTTLNIAGALTNNGGTFASNGAVTANAGSMANQGGKFQAAGSSDLNLTVTGPLDNSAGGQLLAGGNATVQAGSLRNDAGSLTAVGNLNATITGAATDIGGTLAANGNTTVTASSLDNSAGTTAAVKGNLAVTTTGTTTNTGGTLQAGGTTTLSNGGLSSAGGKVFGNSLSIDTHGNALDNSAKGTIAATTTVDIQSGALQNDTGLIQSGGAMTIGTNGHALTNTNAAGYSNGQGGITSAGTLTLIAGAVNSSAGFIGAGGALNANTGAFTNTAGGQVIGKAAVTVNADGAIYDNSGGQTQAVGVLTVSAGNIQNVGGLLRSSADTTLNAATVNNANTSGTNQGIEGTNVAITTATLGNQHGAVRAAQDLTVTSGGTIDNSAGGLLSAGDTEKLVDPNAVTPGAKTLNVVNTGGTLVATNSLQIDAANFSNNGSFTSGRDMAIALTQDIVNTRDVSVSGNLTYGTTGHLTHNAKLLAGQTLTVNGNVVDNTATGEMSGTNTIVNAGTLNNRGLIDSQGNTQVNTGTLNNIGTGRIYGNAVSISAGNVLNDTETIGGTTTAATIASRGDLDIGAVNLTNREHALIFSSGDMAIGGALDANRAATGQGGTLDNLSADIQSLGNMALSMANVNNRDTHIQLGTPSTVPSVLLGVQPVTLLGSGVGRTNLYLPSEVTLDPVNGFVYRKDTGELVGMGGYSLWTNNLTTVTDTAINADPAHLIAGGNMTVTGRLFNQDSQVIAGGTITASDYQSSQLTGQVQVSGLASAVDNHGNVQATNVPLVAPPQSIALGAYKYQQNLNATTGYNAGSAAKGSGSATGGGAGGASGGAGAGVIVEVAASVGTVAGKGGAGAGAAGGASAGSIQSVPTVVRTSTPNLSVPQASLFRTQAGGNYLIETDPRFANYRNWLSSDYLLSNLGLDPSNTLKRLGDGFYEQQLIREQVAQLTGYRYVAGYSNDLDEYTALMNSGLTFAKEYGLQVGVALTAAQMAQLTSDIVWLVQQTVTLPDGTTQQVLVPQVYVRVQPGDIDGSGALLSANAVNITGKGNDLLNTGTIAGRRSVTIDANTVNNLGGRISGGTVAITAAGDINNIGGTIDARDRLTLDAARDINVRTTTSAGTPGNQIIDRVAGLYVTNPRGVLTASAGNDINLVGASVDSGGKIAMAAGNNLNLETVTEQTAALAIGKTASFGVATSKEVGTTIVAPGNVSLGAGNNLAARAANVTSGGTLTVQAANNVQIEDGRDQTAMIFTSQSSKHGLLKHTTSTLDLQGTTDTSVSSNLSGGKVIISAALGDVNVIGSNITATGDLAIHAGGAANIVSSLDSANAQAQTSSHSTGLNFSGGGRIDSSINHGAQASLATSSEHASNVTSTGGQVDITGTSEVNIYASNVSAAGDVNVTGGTVTIVSGLNETQMSASSQSDSHSIAPNVLPHSLVSGINSRTEVTNRSDTTTLAASTLSGDHVNITATGGDLTLIAPTINASEGVALSATEGAVNFGVVKTTTEVSQDRSGKSIAYQRTSDSGSHAETANYTQINSPSLTVAAGQVNAQVGQATTIVPTGPGQSTVNVPQQTTQQAVQALLSHAQGGTSWVNQLANDPGLDGKINWQAVPVGQRQWAQSQGGLTQTGAAIITIVASVLTWGAASEIGAVVGDTVAVGAGEGVALGGGGALLTDTGLAISGVTGAAVSAGISSIASQAAVALVNENGDIGAALRDLGSSASIKKIVTAMATAGVIQGINIGLDIQGYTPANIGASIGDTTVGWTQVLSRNLIDGAAAGLVYSAVNNTSLETSIKSGLVNGFLTTAAAGSANWIGNNGPTGEENFNAFSAEVAHAVAGCIVGAGRASGGGYGGGVGSGCSAGAIGAVVGHLAGQMYNPTNDPLNASATIDFGRMMAGIAGALVGGNQASADIAAEAGANAVENNQLGLRDAPKTIEAQKNRLAKIFASGAGFMDSFQDVCPQCSAEGFKKMDISISPDIAGKASDGSPALAIFDPNTGQVIVYQSFFAQSSITQLGLLVHEYTHTIQGANTAIPSADSPLWGHYATQPWEVEANKIQEAFRKRYGTQYLTQIGGLF